MAEALAIAGEANQSISPEPMQCNSHVVDVMCDNNINPESDQKFQIGRASCRERV